MFTVSNFLRVALILSLSVPQLVFSAKQQLLVSAAMSLKDAMVEIARDFEKINPNVKIVLNLASSGSLRAQIENGAPVDVFASASQKHMDLLQKKELIVLDSRKEFAKNSLVLLTNKNELKKLFLEENLNKLQVKSIKRIAIGNYKTVPAGRYAHETLKYYKLWNKLESKMIYGRNVRQVLDYLARGEVDLGFVYATDGLKRKDLTILVQISAKTHTPIVYPIAIVKRSAKNELGRNFIDFVLSKEGQAILRKYGFKI